MNYFRNLISTHKVAWVLGTGATVITIAMGVRTTFGIFIQPLSVEHGVSISMISFAIALQNLVWGVSQPFIGAISDRYGAGRVIVIGGLLYSLGMVVTVVTSTPVLIIFGAGLLVGLAQSCTTFAVVLGVIGRNFDEKRRPMALGIASAGGSFGLIALVPIAQGLIDIGGLNLSIFFMAGMTFLIAPLAIFLAGKPDIPNDGSSQMISKSLMEIIQDALRHRSFILLTLGFFTCGFQIAFIQVHLPVFLFNCGLPVHVDPGNLAATALATIGLFNMLGTYAHGLLGTKYLMKNLLALNYTLRGVIILVFFLLPKTEYSVLVFSVSLGVLWLGTVPLTSGVVAKMFGPENLGMLFGICFLSHQVGSFLGVWVGGYMFDLTGNYDLIWILTAVAGIIAAALNWPIRERTFNPNAVVHRV